MNGHEASSTDPTTHATYDKITTEKKGIVLLPDMKLICIDIDHCLDEDSKIVHGQKEVIADFLLESDSYTEISQSGKGLHIFLAITEPLYLVKKKHEPFEAYTDKRFIAVTENCYGESRDVRTVTPDEAQRLLKIIGYPWGYVAPQPTTKRQQPTTNLDDATLLAKMFNSKTGAKIKAIYDGDISAYNNDDSSADMALCSSLAFWTSKNAEQMERMWLGSTLGQRVKTQEREDYRSRTIANAILKCAEVYESGRTRSGKSVEDDDSKVLPLAEVAKLYAVKTPAVSTGFKKIDDAMRGGMIEGDLIIVSGQSGHGKTLFAQTMAYHLAKADIPSAFFSYELGVDEIWFRFKEMGVEDDFKVSSPDKMIANRPKWIKKKILEAKEKYGAKVVFIDHLGFLENDVSEGGGDNANLASNGAYQLGALCRVFKRMAIDERIIIVLMAHVRKPQGYGKEVGINDLAYSAGIAQEADHVLMIKRQEESGRFLDISKIKLVKNRRTGKMVDLDLTILGGKFIEPTTAESEREEARQETVTAAIKAERKMFNNIDKKIKPAQGFLK